ncbi:MAG: hypothetical protein EHM20_05545, partial [Alphaproteobacteria bacterium]
MGTHKYIIEFRKKENNVPTEKLLKFDTFQEKTDSIGAYFEDEEYDRYLNTYSCREAVVNKLDDLFKASNKN